MGQVIQRKIYGKVLAQYVNYFCKSGRTQRWLADQIGVHTSTFSKWKRGEGTPEVWAALLMDVLRADRVIQNPEEALDWWSLVGYTPSEKEMMHWYPRWKQTRRIALHSQTPGLSDYHIVRQAEQNHIISKLLTESSFRQPATKHLYLWGMGGTGKTVIAKAVALDKEVQAYFRDGVLWGKKQRGVWGKAT